MVVNENAVMQQLYNQIVTIVEQINEKNDKTVLTAIIGKEKNKYIVKINGAEYKVWNGTGFKLSVGQQVWVTIPQGDYSRIFINGFKSTKEI